jgi:hypothetical protein
VTNSIAGGLTAFFIYLAGCKHVSPLVGLLAAWAWAVLPIIALTDTTLSNYAFATLAVVLWLNFVPDLAPKAYNWAWLGIATGLMLLLNPMLALLVPATVLSLRKKQAVVVAAIALLVLTPWYVRNYRVMHHFYPALRDNLGMELYLGNHAGMSGTCDYWTGKSPYGGELPKIGEARFFELRRSDAIEFIQSAPKGFAVRSLKRFAQFWLSPWPILYIPLLFLAAWGTLFVPSPLAVFALMLFMVYPLVFYVTQTAWPTAYRHPIEPMILLMAATATVRIYMREIHRPDARRTRARRSSNYPSQATSRGGWPSL